MLMREVISTGRVTTAIVNLEKCHGPSQNLAILGIMYDAVGKRCNLPVKKQHKYILALLRILIKGSSPSKDLEKIVGYLVYASYVEPFGRPFISAISSKIDRKNTSKIVEVTDYVKMAMEIWVGILKRNTGISYSFILAQLERGKDEWFVDASTSWGIGGCAGKYYFLLENQKLSSFFGLFANCNYKEKMEIPFQRLPIAYLELLAALVGFACFSTFQPNKIIRLNSDNTDVVAWLTKSRCSAGVGFKFLAAIEFYKREYNLKITTRHIMGRHNNSADSLSRGVIPIWLQKYGTRVSINIEELYLLTENPISFWN